MELRVRVVLLGRIAFCVYVATSLVNEDEYIIYYAETSVQSVIYL